MRLAFRSSQVWCLLAALLLLRAVALAGPAEISGIEKVYLRAGPGSDQAPLGVLSAGDRVNIIEVEGSWTKVETADGTVGFVYHRFVVPIEGGATDGGATEGGATGLAPEAPPTVRVVPTPRPRPTSPLIPTPVSYPTVAAPPSPAATSEAKKDEISAEVADLRAEIAELREKIQQRGAENGESPVGGPFAVSPAGDPSHGGAPAPAAEQGAGVLAVAFLSLLVGWVLGSAFGRRRSKTQRGRLRM